MRCLSTAGILGTENVGQVWPFKEKRLCTEARLYIQSAVALVSQPICLLEVKENAVCLVLWKILRKGFFYAQNIFT